MKKIITLFLVSAFAFLALSPITNLQAKSFETYKATNYSIEENSGTFWYENENNSFTVDGILFQALIADTDKSIAKIDEVNGVPIWGESDYLITTKKVFLIDNGEVVKKDGIGHIEGVTEVLGVAYEERQKEIIIDAFADAYLFAYDRGAHNLGKPLGLATVITDGDEQALVQEFDNGKIVMNNYQSPAFPIYGKILEAWETSVADGGLGLLSEDGIGAPIGRQFEVEGKVYQNFQYGWAELENNEVKAKFSNDNGVDYNGLEVNRLLGFFESRANVAIGNPDFEHELLRIQEAYIQAYSKVRKTGYIFYRGGIRTGHEWNGTGITQYFDAGDSTANPWGRSSHTILVMKNPYMNPQVVRNSILDQYALKGNDQAGSIGFPISEDYTVKVTVKNNDENVDLNVTFQNFEGGYIRSYLVGFNVYTEEYSGFNVDENGVAKNIETNEEATHKYDLSGLEPTDPVDPIDPVDPVNPVEPDKEPKSLTWLWISLGVIALLGAGTAAFFVIKKRS